MLVDHLGAPGAAHVGSDQLALHRRGGEPLVPQRDRKIGQPGKIAGEGAGRLRARSFAGVHVDGQAEHEADGAALGGDGDQARRVGRERLALDGPDPGREPAVGIGHRDADGLGSEVESDQRAALRPVRDGFDQGQDESGHAFA